MLISQTKPKLHGNSIFKIIGAKFYVLNQLEKQLELTNEKYMGTLSTRALAKNLTLRFARSD